MLLTILRWILQVLTPAVPVQLGLFHPLLSRMFNTLRTRGFPGLISFCKGTRTALLHALSGEYPSKTVEGVPVFKDGFPKSLGAELVKMLRQDSTRIIYLRLCLTLLFSTRALSTGKVPDISAIQDPPSVAELPDLSKYKVQFWRDLGYRPSLTKVPRGTHFKEYHFTTKAGPNGQAMWTSMVDLKLLRDLNLLEPIIIIGGPKLKYRIDLLVKVLDYLPKFMFPVSGNTTRRLSWFPDMESKVRVVAILDFWSQTALRPFHDYIFKVLRKIPQDCTFDQGSFLSKTESWEYYYSYDLTNATDRFPIDTICMVLEGLIPSFWVQSWRKVMVGIPFDYKRNKTLEKVSYGVGNPMGAYSSWNTFSLSHHYVMYWCCKELGIDWKTSKYCLLGDDILIGDHQLAKLYLETMTLLGVGISPIKSHCSSKLFEFAKRLVLNRTEITPFPISALPESSKRFYLLTSLLMQESKKGWSWPEGIPFTVGKFYEVVLQFNSVYRAKIEDRSFLCETMINIMGGRLAADNGLNDIIRRFDIQLPELSLELSLDIVSSVALEVFAESNPFEVKGGPPFGQLAEEWVISLLTLENLPIEADAFNDLPSTVPILNLYGQVCDKWTKIRNQVVLIDTIGKGEWPMHLRTLALPFSDKVFSERASHTITRVGSVLGDRLLKKINDELSFLRKLTIKFS